MERLYQEVRLISTSNIIALWVLPANIDARHLPNTLLNLDSGSSQQFVCLSAQLAEQRGTHRSSGGTEHTAQTRAEESREVKLTHRDHREGSTKMHHETSDKQGAQHK